MRRIKNKSILKAKKLHALSWRHKLKSSYLHEGVPYFAQWESRELVEDIISGKMKAGDDPRWRESGAENKAEYSLWSWSGCGMACLKMILAATEHETPPLVMLAKQCLVARVYQEPLESSPGLFYKPFVSFIKNQFGFEGKSVAALTTAEIKRALGQGAYVIASVTPEIRHPHKKPKQKGGHLVLMLGYDDNKKVFYLHNPSGFKKTQEYFEISYKNFPNFFSHKGILIWT